MRARVLVAVALAVVACQEVPTRPVGPDAMPPAPDAASTAPCEPSDLALELGANLDAGAIDDLLGQGPGAWITRRAVAPPPGEMLYLEAYSALIDGNKVVFDEFQNWQYECGACVFLGRGCQRYEVAHAVDPVDGFVSPLAPRTCEHLFMLEQGVVSFTRLETDPSAGAIEGTISPLPGSDSIRVAEIFEAYSDPNFGEKLPGGQCLNLPAISFSASW